MDDVSVAASGFALRVGKPAPELKSVAAWKNTPGLTLADLRGKWVLLNFLGPCVNAGSDSRFIGQQMRELLTVHDTYNGKGLTVIAICWNLAPTPAANLAQDFDKTIEAIGKREWEGRGLPFPVALTSETVRIGEGGRITDTVRADYGIIGWPPSVLIDPEGTIAGGLDVLNIAGIALLDRLIGADEAPQKSN